MKIDKFTFGMRGHDLGANFEEMVENAVANNISNLQFAPAKTMSDVDFDKVGFDETIAQQVASTLDENNLKVSVLGCYINPVDPATLENALTRFENFILYAKAFGATVIGTETGWVETLEKTHSPEVYSAFLKNLERLLVTAENNDVTIGIEPVWANPIRSVAVMKDVLNNFKSDNLKVIFDPNNLININNYTQQKEIIDEATELLGDDIAILHLKDFTVDEKHHSAPLGEGMFEAKYCLDKIATLKNIPDVILDEMSLVNLEKVTANLKKILL